MQKNRKWFRVALRWQGSVIPAIRKRVIVCGGFGVLISGLHHLNVPVSLPVLGNIVPSIVLGLLLVFRTNTAYERFWEGRKLWGHLVNTTRNLARQIWLVIQVQDPGDRQTKEIAMKELVAFAVSLKLHLRREPVNEELLPFLQPIRYQQLQVSHHPPLKITLWLGEYLQQQYQRDRLTLYQLEAMHQLLNQMVDVLGGCERILKTPIPLAYAIHLKQLVLIYCLALPFQLVASLEWATGPIVGLISFTLFGIEEIGIEIENPFGHDPNDLPIDAICQTLHHNIDELTQSDKQQSNAPR